MVYAVNIWMMMRRKSGSMMETADRKPVLWLRLRIRNTEGLTMAEITDAETEEDTA